MKPMISAVVGSLVATMLMVISVALYVHAQTPASIVQFDTVQGSVSTCQTHTGVSTLCLGTDGLVFSSVGAKYGPNLAIPSASGVTSVTINGVTKPGPIPAFNITGTTAAPLTAIAAQ